MDRSAFIKQYESDGYVILKQFLPSELVAGMKQAVDQIVDTLAQQRMEAGELSDRYEDTPFETRYLKVFEDAPEKAPVQFVDELHVDAFYDMMSYPPLLDLAESVLGGEIRLAPGYFVRPKAFPDHRFQSLWHQDAAYLYLGNQGHPREAFDRIRTMNVWTPLVPVNQNNGCMQFIPGTHTDGMAEHVPLPPHDYLEIDRTRLDPALHSGRVVDVVLDPGDIVLFNTLLFHQGQDNHSGQVRWSVDFRFQDARQSTLIDLQGHLLCSQVTPEKTVRSRCHWRSLSVA